MYIKRNLPYIFLFATFTALILMYLFRQLAMLDSTNTCGKVEREFTIKGNTTFIVGFYISGKKKDAKVSSQAFKIKDLKMLRKYDCIKIKYSNSFPSYIEIVDKKLRSGSGW